MCNQQHRHVILFLEVFDQVEDLRLDRNIQGRGRLIGDQQGRVAAQRHGNHHPLPHPAGHLVRIGADPLLRIGHPDQPQHLHRSFPCLMSLFILMEFHGLHDLVPHRIDRIQAGHRFLKDHGNFVAANLPHLLFRKAQQVLPVKQDFPLGDFPRRIGNQPQNGKGRHALPAAALPHHRQRLALLNIIADVIDGFQFPILREEGNLQISYG
ncbi:MAG: hypothetical protein BWY71_01527 [Planctomycetes bacterium ADurb.Bin412]|nr:MAG: hypothetical protein BWY71_01527 [Planctomycetes bacterium ADurb.Bin412]